MNVIAHPIATGPAGAAGLPLLVFHGAVDPQADDPAAALERLFARHGWPPAWRNGIYDWPHFHAVCHEVLGIARGAARVRFGAAPHGAELHLKAGDVAVLPAGTLHERLSSSDDLLVVGAYPAGSDYDLHRGLERGEPALQAAIDGVPLPPRDPVLGEGGGVVAFWHSGARSRP